MAIKKVIVIDIYRQNILNIAEDVVLQRQASKEHSLYLTLIQELGFVLNFDKQSPGQNSSQCHLEFIWMWPSGDRYFLGCSSEESFSGKHLYKVPNSEADAQVLFNNRICISAAF